MIKTFILLIAIATLAYGCVETQVGPKKTQLEIREFQTRSYDTKDTKMVMKALLNVLQDDGYVVKNANVDLGLLTAAKETDVENKGTAVLLAILGGRDARWTKNSTIECSGNITEFGDQTRVRVNFQMKLINNRGEPVDVKQIEDPQFYQEFFAKVDKGIFIQKEKI